MENYMQVVRARRNQGLFILFAGFMQKLCWQPAKEAEEKARRTWVPFSKDSMEDKKPKSKTREVMEAATTYLARGECTTNGEGYSALNPNEVERAIKSIQNWMFYFVSNMKSKPNKQLITSCLESNANYVSMKIARGEPYRHGEQFVCDHGVIFTTFEYNVEINGVETDVKKIAAGFHANEPHHLLGTEGAKALADNIFRAYYDGETRAMSEPTLSPYFSREAGPVEFGETLSDEKHLPRQFAEAPTGEYYLTAEDEHAAAWVMSDISEDFASEDEPVANDEGDFKLVIDISEREIKYGELLVAMIRSKSMDECNSILAKARTMAEAEIIGWWQFSKLRDHATDTVNRRAREFRNSRASEVASMEVAW